MQVCLPHGDLHSLPVHASLIIKSRNLSSCSHPNDLPMLDGFVSPIMPKDVNMCCHGTQHQFFSPLSGRKGLYADFDLTLLLQICACMLQAQDHSSLHSAPWLCQDLPCSLPSVHSHPSMSEGIQYEPGIVLNCNELALHSQNIL